MPQSTEITRRTPSPCFDHFGTDPQEYGYATTLGLEPSCEREVIGQLVELRAAAAEYAHRDGRLAPDDLFFAECNAQVVANAEQYYRVMFRSNVASWNLRDIHMADTLFSLGHFLELQGSPSRIVVWAHNSHQGDARATELGQRGELNLGQLARERFGTDAVLVGFTTHSGTVTAASDWGAHAGRKVVRERPPHKIYPEAIRLFSEGRLKVDGRTVRITDYRHTDQSMVNPSIAP